MLVTQTPVLQRFWYPVMPLAHLHAGPQAFQLLTHPLVLWLDADGQPAVAQDRCCHRSARLSRGQVIDGSIRCPYHGWTFNSTGQCVQVPQLSCAEIPRTYQVQAYACAERYGYIWVCLHPDPLVDIPVIAEAEDPDFRMFHQFYEPWACAGLRVMENSFDNAHFSIVHTGTFGDQSDPRPATFELIEHPYGFQVNTTYAVRNPPEQQKNLGIVEEMTVRMNQNIWFMPFTRKLHITYPNGLQHIIITSATPIDNGTSQLVQFCLRNDSEADAPAADVTAFDRAVTLEDKDVLETTDYDVPLDISAEQHMASDKPGILMRHQLAALIRAHP